MNYKYTQHYVYRITNIVDNKHYYGVRTSKNISPKEDIGINYFSSSTDKKFRQDQKENPQDYKYKVVKIFDTRKEANTFEILLHNKFKVSSNENFYNRAIASSNMFCKSGTKDREYTTQLKRKSILGYKHRNSTKIKISKIVENMWKDEDYRKMQSKAHSKKIGKDNPRCISVLLYDCDNNLQYDIIGLFSKAFVNEDNLPIKAIRHSLKINKPIYEETVRPSAIGKLKVCGYWKYKGWTAIYKEDVL